MQLTEEQKAIVAGWIRDGLKLSDVQRRLDEELGVRLTYMEARFLIDDLQLTPLDPPEAPKADAPLASAAPVNGVVDEVLPPESFDAPMKGSGKLSVKVDEITRPGAIVSGSVVFSDGGKAGWHMDQTGRLGMAPESPAYRPSPADVAEFQVLLERELVKLGI